MILSLYLQVIDVVFIVGVVEVKLNSYSNINMSPGHQPARILRNISVDKHHQANLSISKVFARVHGPNTILH